MQIIIRIWTSIGRYGYVEKAGKLFQKSPVLMLLKTSKWRSRFVFIKKCPGMCNRTWSVKEGKQHIIAPWGRCPQIKGKMDIYQPQSMNIRWFRSWIPLICYIMKDLIRNIADIYDLKKDRSAFGPVWRKIAGQNSEKPWRIEKYSIRKVLFALGIGLLVNGSQNSGKPLVNIWKHWESELED